MIILMKILEKIAVPLIVAAILALFGMYSRLNATELEQATLKQDLREARVDILALRCALLKEEITCLKFRALNGT